MKQVLQPARGGVISVTDVPAPKLLPGCVLVRIAASLVSAGTERAVSDFSRKNLLQKAKARPDLVRDVITKVRRDGIFSAMTAVRSRLDQPGALGYSSAGTIIAVGEGVTELNVGDHVACSGAGYAVHAQFACIPRLLAAKVPTGSTVTPEEAAFSTIGAVAMHGIRLAEASLGDLVAVIGLGLVGQLTIQMLKAAGCRVIGMDLLPWRTHLAQQVGADAVCSSTAEFRDLCLQYSRGIGADAVVIAAETSSSDPVNLAAEVARDRAIVVAVGTVAMNIDRKLYYERELDFRVSRSYGPGRYDSAYEQKGRDYPIGHVRWTENRNLEAFIHLLAARKLDVRSLITHRFPIDRANDAYDLITGRSSQPFLGVLITYPGDAVPTHHLELVKRAPLLQRPEQCVAVGFLGAGNFATATLLPAMGRLPGVKMVTLCSATGAKAQHVGTKFRFHSCATDEDQVFSSSTVNTIVVATRHHLHAEQVMSALQAGKHVFCEKPLCLTEGDLAKITRLHASRRQLLVVGFNRRFSPMALRMKSFLDESREPLAIHYRINAGALPPDHWVNDPEQGGGRILGEVCHFIDFLMFLAGSSPTEVQTATVANSSNPGDDSAIISLKFSDGSQGTISYLTSGDRSYSKERIEVFSGGAVAILDDFRRLELIRHAKKRTSSSRFRQDKGHRAELDAFCRAIRSGSEAPTPFHEIIASTLATLKAAESQKSGQRIPIDAATFIRDHSSCGPAATAFAIMESDESL